MRLQRLLLAIVLGATGCSTGATSSTPAVATTDIAATARLQFAVGTATIGSAGGTVIGTNVVATFRGPDGHSAILSNTPTITGPPNFVVGFPGSLNALTGVRPSTLSQDLLALSATEPALPAALGATLGPFVGVFGYGLAADNLVSSQVAAKLNVLGRSNLDCPDLGTVPGVNVQIPNGVPITTGSLSGGTLTVPSEAQSQELGNPLGSGPNYTPQNVNAACPVDALSASGRQPVTSDLPVNYYGGPPAWPSAQGYGTPAFFVGYPVGFTDVAAAPVAGAYTLDVAYATNSAGTTYGHMTATAQLANLAPLPPLVISSAAFHADGSATVVVDVPPGLTEAIVFVRTSDCVNRQISANYAIVTHSAGTQSFVFGAHLGEPDASGQPSQTFCTIGNTGNAVGGTAFAVGFDYPAYESSYPFNLSPTPTIANAAHQADVTTSAPFIMTQSE